MEQPKPQISVVQTIKIWVRPFKTGDMGILCFEMVGFEQFIIAVVFKFLKMV